MTENAQSPQGVPKWLYWIGIAACVYGILVAVGMVGAGFKWGTGGKDGARELFEFATNPFTALLVGMFATALVQSSSTVTSVIVGLAAGGLPIESAIPMIMGANIGTTITNTIVSLGHAGKKKEFKRAFAAATVHDFFNVFAVVIFLPLELLTGFLAKVSAYFSGMLVGGDSMSIKGFNFIKPITKPVIKEIKSFLNGLPIDDKVAAVILALLGVALIFVSIMVIGKLLKVVMVGRAKAGLHAAVGRGPLSGITSGALVTVAVQSSSTTTSLIVPLAGTGVFKLREIYPFTLGANIGTTITAILAATAISGDGALAAMQIAMVHFAYNFTAVALIFGLPSLLNLVKLRDLPINCAQWLAEVAADRKLIALAYIALVFFAIPAVLIFATAK
jgi:sodium-dependent phosphate cotransporter